jgi:hypothetical protein
VPENLVHSRAATPFRLSSIQVRALRDERYREFQRRTADYLRSAFPALFTQRTDEELHAVADLALQRANAWGKRSEREIWEYLIPMCFLGSYFDADPQYWHMLSKAGWQRTEPPVACDIKALRLEIDTWFPIIDRDYIDLAALTKAVANAYLTAETRLAHSELMFDVLEQHITTLSPARWAQLPAAARRPWFEACNNRARELGFGGAEGLAYCIASFFFGFAFERNAVYPWAWKTVVEMEGTNQARVLAFAKEAHNHLDVLARCNLR